jgi:hypothetical protein
MAQGHREVRPGTPPLQGVRIIERSATLSGRLAGLLLADQGADVFVERGAGIATGDFDDAFFDRGKVALPPDGTAEADSADIVILDGTAQFERAPHQVLVRIMAALPEDEAYGDLPHNCSEDLINALGGFFTNMSISGPLLNRPVIYTRSRCLPCIAASTPPWRRLPAWLTATARDLGAKSRRAGSQAGCRRSAL